MLEDVLWVAAPQDRVEEEPFGSRPAPSRPRRRAGRRSPGYRPRVEDDADLGFRALAPKRLDGEPVREEDVVRGRDRGRELGGGERGGRVRSRATRRSTARSASASSRHERTKKI